MRALWILAFTFACSTSGEPPKAAPGPGTGQPCAEGRCAEGLECVGYYGVAGTKGPKLTSCERRCDDGAACPEGQACVTIADGPGQVCRPKG